MWPTIRPLIVKALAYGDGTITPDQIRANLLKGKQQLLFCPKPVCILITELLNYPNGQRSCDISLTAGDFPNDWRSILEQIEEWARSKNCSFIEMRSPRKAWTRRLPDWRPVTVVYRKELRP